jgi:hypothetical protein
MASTLADAGFGMYLPSVTPATIAAAETGIGRRLDFVMDYANWNNGSSAWPTPSYLATLGSRPLVWTIQPSSGPYGASTANCVQWAPLLAGTYDAQIIAFATWVNANLTAAPVIYVRFAHEMNGTGWYDWQVGESCGVTSAANYAAGFNHVASVLKAHSGKILTVWSPNNGYTNFSSFYPSSCDIMALDAYNYVGGNAWYTDTQIMGGTTSTSPGFGPYAQLTAIDPVKPIWVGETASEDTAAFSYGGSTYGPFTGPKSAWVETFYGSASYPRVTATTWFNIQKERQFQWDSSADSQTGFQTAFSAYTSAAGSPLWNPATGGFYTAVSPLTYRASGSATSGTTQTGSWTGLSLDASIQAGDLVLVLVSSSSGTATQATYGISGGGVTTWTAAGTQPSRAGSGSAYVGGQLFKGIAASGGGGTLTLTTSRSTDYMQAAYTAYSGAAAIPVDVYPAPAGYNTAATSFAAPSGTTGTTTDWCVSFYTGNYSTFGSGSFTAPAGALTMRSSVSGPYGEAIGVADSAAALPPGSGFGGGNWGYSTTSTALTFSVAIAAAPSTITGTSTVTGVARVTAMATGGPSRLATWNSLRIGGDIELLGDPAGSSSVNPVCPGADFNLQPGYDLGVAQSITDVIEALAIDGSRPLGRRSGNRKLSIPIHISAPSFAIMAAAREYLLQTVNQDKWQLTWTRAQDSEPAPLPLIIDCFRGSPPGTGYGGVDEVDRNPIWPVTVNCEALPYGRSDTPVQVIFPSPLQGQTAPSGWMGVDPYTTVSSTTQAGAWSRANWPGSAYPYAARWNRDGGYSFPIYTRTLPGPVNISGYKSWSVWVGFGTDNWCQWHQGSITFSFTLTDGGGHTITFGGTKWCTATSSPGNPIGQYEVFPIPIVSGFDYTTVSAYSATMWTSGSGSTRSFAYNTTDAYLNCLGVDPPAKGFPAVGTTRGALYRISAVGTARAPVSLQFQQPGTPGTSTATFTTPGQTWWTPPAGVTDPTGATLNSIQGQVWGAGGAGSRRTTSGVGGGGSGGEFASNLTLPVNPGTPVSVWVGAGAASLASPVNGGDSHIGGWDEAAGGIVGHGGLSAAANSATGVSGDTGTSISPLHYTGGAGANGGTPSGGGGSSAGTGAVGGNAAGQTGGTPPAGGGAGGGGGNSGGNNNGTAGSAPGGAGGGATSTGGTGTGGAGANGKAVIQWSGTIPTFKTLFVHRPGPDSPTTFMPVIPVGNGADTPNGGTEYLIATPDTGSGINAKYNGTYTCILMNSSWHTPANARDITVIFKQYDYPGGSFATMPVGGSTPSRTVTPTPDIGTNGVVILGEITLPLRDIDDDNTTAYLSATVTSSDTADRFLDIILLDTGGSTVLISTGDNYANYWLDEPDIDQGLGNILGSVYGRSQARSVHDSILAVSGGPMTFDPGNNSLFAYAVEGAPTLFATYTPRFWLDRTV